MNNFTQQEYFQEVEAIAQAIIEEIVSMLESADAEEIREFSNDNGTAYEWVDSHEYSIYNWRHLPILGFSDNAEAYIEELGAESAGEVLKQNGLSGLHAALASFAFLRDVEEKMSELLNEMD